MRDQVIRFNDRNRLRRLYQSAKVLVKITNAIQRDCDRRFFPFDNVQHSLLLRKLSLYFKFGGTAVDLVGSFLSDRYL
jgi:hypothetical protein